MGGKNRKIKLSPGMAARRSASTGSVKIRNKKSNKLKRQANLDAKEKVRQSIEQQGKKPKLTLGASKIPEQGERILYLGVFMHS